jgi:hypothetical protein
MSQQIKDKVMEVSKSFAGTNAKANEISAALMSIDGVTGFLTTIWGEVFVEMADGESFGFCCDRIEFEPSVEVHAENISLSSLLVVTLGGQFQSIAAQFSSIWKQICKRWPLQFKDATTD